MRIKLPYLFIYHIHNYLNVTLLNICRKDLDRRNQVGRGVKTKDGFSTVQMVQKIQMVQESTIHMCRIPGSLIIQLDSLGNNER